MLLRTVRRPAAVRALEFDGLRLRFGMRVGVRVSGSTNRARRKRLDGLATSDDGRKRGLGERVEEIILGQYWGGLCGAFSGGGRGQRYCGE